MLIECAEGTGEMDSDVLRVHAQEVVWCVVARLHTRPQGDADRHASVMS